MHIRAVAQAPFVLHRLLLTSVTAFLLIAGLLAMHTLTGAHTGGHAEAPAAAPEAADTVADPVMGRLAMTAGALETSSRTGPYASAGRCAGDCDNPSGMPDHLTLMMVCVLALLAGAIVLRAPALLRRLGVTLALLRPHGRNMLATLRHLRPPSLLVLSISRT